MSITDERKKSIDFTNFYYNTPSMMMGAKNGDMDITPAHLAGKTLGVQVSTTHQAYAEKYYAESTLKPTRHRKKQIRICFLDGSTTLRLIALHLMHF